MRGVLGHLKWNGKVGYGRIKAEPKSWEEEGMSAKKSGGDCCQRTGDLDEPRDGQAVSLAAERVDAAAETTFSHGGDGDSEWP
jgi:hypothetical protein